MPRVARQMIDKDDRNLKEIKRIPLYEQAEQIKVVNKDSKYAYRVVTKRGNRIEKFKLAGWQIVTNPKEAGQISDVHNNISLGAGAEINAGIYKDTREPIRCILMKIHKDIKAKDDAAKQAVQDKVMEGIYKGDTEEETAKSSGITATATVEEAIHRKPMD